ncbi:MAG: hypothetical protein K1X78_22135 [Verrucomicrobiaceae bacterium]|nr:hypothetical protein [Verrucomicrobiaceae bacterium]
MSIYQPLDDNVGDNQTGSESREAVRRTAQRFLQDLRAARQLRVAMDLLLGSSVPELFKSLENILEVGFERCLRAADEEDGHEKIEELVLAMDGFMVVWREEILPLLERAVAAHVPLEAATIGSIELHKGRGKKMGVRINGWPLQLSGSLVPVMTALMSPSGKTGDDLAPFKAARDLARALGIKPGNVAGRVNRFRDKLGTALRGAVETRRVGMETEYRLRIPSNVARRFLRDLPAVWQQKKPDADPPTDAAP